ncbi:MAG: hypothetical protein ACR2NP_09720, partial [Pirellulaceae bacterium]
MLARMFPFAAVLLVFACPASTDADQITANDIIGLSNSSVGSGNGTLDLRMFTFSGGEVKNEKSGNNYDNANNSLPNANSGGDTWS